MPQNQHSMNRVSLGLFISVLFCLMSVYLITYSGRIESSDSLLVVDATSSLVHFGDTRRDESLWQEAPRNIDADNPFPFGVYNFQEPLVAYTSAIPASFTKNIPTLGFVHTTWLLNIFTISLSGALFFYLARLLNYDTRTAIIGALGLGLGTILWAYSKTLFRDPLVVMFLLLTVIFLEHWRKKYRHVWWLIPAGLAMLGAYYAKNSSIVAIPALVIWILPDWKPHTLIAIILDSLLAFGLIIFVLIAFNQTAFDEFTYIMKQFISFDARFVQTAFHSYLFSIGGSIWGTSPILVIGFIGGIMLAWQNQRRLLWSILALILAYAMGHALLSGVHWFGGLSLPPRFMLATIPFAMLLTLPVIDWVLKSQQIIWKILFSVLALFSIAVQIIFSVSLLDAYPELIPQEANGLVEWLPGLNQVEYLRWVLLPQSWASLGWDTAWSWINAEYIMLGFVIIAIASGLAICLPKYRIWLNIIIGIALSVFTLFSFQTLYWEDTRYWADTPELFEVLSILEREADPVEPLFLAGSADVTYERFILNYNSLTNIRPIVLGFAQGERTSPSDTPTIVSDFNSDRINVTMLRYLDHVASFQDRMWWLAHNSEFMDWSIRPEERYLTENYYLLNDYRIGNSTTVRLLEFSTVQAPNRFSFTLPENRSDFRFGEHITLKGYDLPSGVNYTVGDTVAITFYWQTDEVIETDYTVSWFLVNSESAYPAIQGVDSVPDGRFAPTLLWEANQVVFDNRAIEIPHDAPAGVYQIWLRLYVTGSGGENKLTVSGGDTFEDTTAILPITITVQDTN